jgi:hypothetical protein
MKGLLALTLVIAAAEARAQAPGTEIGGVLIVGPPALLAVAVDASLLYSLVPKGNARRGSSITGLAVGSVTAIIGAGMILAGVGSLDTTATWMAIAATGLAVGVGSIGLALYAFLHPEPEPDVPVEVPTVEEPPLPRIPPPSPPQLRLIPLFGRGVWGGALSLPL